MLLEHSFLGITFATTKPSNTKGLNDNHDEGPQNGRDAHTSASVFHPLGNVPPGHV